MVLTEEGRGCFKSYDFASMHAAEEFFRHRWVARLLLDEDNQEVCASSGFNPLALGRLRSKLRSMKKSRKAGNRDLHTAVTKESHRVVVESISGNCVEQRFPGSATARDVKDLLESSWGIAHPLQKLILGTREIEDCDTVGALQLTAAERDRDSLRMLMVADSSLLQQEYDKLWLKVNLERMKPTNKTSQRRLLKLLEKADSLEESALQKGVKLECSRRNVRVQERPSSLAPERVRKKKAPPTLVAMPFLF
jgi:hypothetical protein